MKLPTTKIFLNLQGTRQRGNWKALNTVILLTTFIYSSFCWIQYHFAFSNVPYKLDAAWRLRVFNNLEFLSYSKSSIKRCTSFGLIMFVFLFHQIIMAIISNRRDYISIKNSNYCPLSFPSQFEWKWQRVLR